MQFEYIDKQFFFQAFQITSIRLFLPDALTKPHFQIFNAVWMHWKVHFPGISDYFRLFLTDALTTLIIVEGFYISVQFSLFKGEVQ